MRYIPPDPMLSPLELEALTLAVDQRFRERHPSPQYALVPRYAESLQDAWLLVTDAVDYALDSTSLSPRMHRCVLYFDQQRRQKGLGPTVMIAICRAYLGLDGTTPERGDLRCLDCSLPAVIGSFCLTHCPKRGS